MMDKLAFMNFSTAPFVAALLEWAIARFDKRLEIADLPMAQTPLVLAHIRDAHARCVHMALEEMVVDLAPYNTPEDPFTSCQINATLWLPTPLRGFGFEPIYSYAVDTDSLRADPVTGDAFLKSSALAFECNDVEDLKQVTIENPILWDLEEARVGIRLWRKHTLEMFSVRDVNMTHTAFGNRRRHINNAIRRSFFYDDRVKKFMPGMAQTVTSDQIMHMLREDEHAFRNESFLQFFSVDQAQAKSVDVTGEVTVRVSADHSAQDALENNSELWDPADLHLTVNSASTYDNWLDKNRSAVPEEVLLP